MNSISGISSRPGSVQFGKNYVPEPEPEQPSVPRRLAPRSLLDAFNRVANGPELSRADNLMAIESQNLFDTDRVVVEYSRAEQNRRRTEDGGVLAPEGSWFSDDSDDDEPNESIDSIFRSSAGAARARTEEPANNPFLSGLTALRASTHREQPRISPLRINPAQNRGRAALAHVEEESTPNRFRSLGIPSLSPPWRPQADLSNRRRNDLEARMRHNYQNRDSSS
ncbi:hypothetical protein [Vampirovibrio sp.]|uniref:hypothetical protein n=1 Tax=Vampirovibrio sp. TaxID=2717857 RepID=UPI003593275C